MRLIQFGVCALVLFSVVQPAGASTATVRSFIGYAYEIGSEKLLYTETHRELRRSDGQIEMTTVYRKPFGDTIAVRDVEFSADPLAPTFTFRDTRTGALEGLRRVEERIIAYYRDDQAAQINEKALDDRRGLVADAGFDRFVRRNWRSLRSGKTIDADFVIPNRLRTLRFKVSEAGKVSVQGEPAVMFKMTPANPLIRLLIGSIKVSYHEEERYLMRYEGLSNVTGDDGESLSVRIEFPVAERGQWRRVSGVSVQDEQGVQEQPEVLYALD